MAKLQNDAKKIANIYNRPSRVHKHYRQTTDGRATAYSEREFTFAKEEAQCRISI